MKILAVLCVLVACAKKSESETSGGPPASTGGVNAPGRAAAPPPAPGVTLEKLGGAPSDWQGQYMESFDQWSFSKRVNGLSVDPSGYYSYSVDVKRAPNLPTNGIELQAKGMAGELEKRMKFFSVEKNTEVPGGAAIIGMRGDKTEDASKADKEFFVVRDLGSGVKISCAPSDTYPGWSDAVNTAAIALCAGLSL